LPNETGYRQSLRASSIHRFLSASACPTPSNLPRTPHRRRNTKDTDRRCPTLRCTRGACIRRREIRCQLPSSLRCRLAPAPKLQRTQTQPRPSISSPCVPLPLPFLGL